MTFQMLNPILAAVAPSPTMRLMERARSLQRAGKDVISLAGGEPDMPPHEAAREVGIDLLRRGNLSYGPLAGLSELRRGIAADLERRHGLAYPIENIMVGVGAKQLLFEALFSATSPGDEIIIPAPYWVSYPAMAALAGGTIKVVQTEAISRFKVTERELRTVVTDRSRWLILNSPSNPTGSVYTNEELGALALVLRQHPRLLVISDDIYEDIVYDEVKHTTITAVAPDLRDRSLICSGFSKGQAMTGLRVGYAAGPAWLIDAMLNLQSHLTSGGCVVGQTVAAGALEKAQDFPEDCRNVYARRRADGIRIMAQTNRLSVRPPDGAFYFWVNVSRLIGGASPNGKRMDSDSAVAEELLNVAGVAVAPSSAFGSVDHIRISFAAEDGLVRKGCERLVAFANSCRLDGL